MNPFEAMAEAWIAASVIAMRVPVLAGEMTSLSPVKSEHLRMVAEKQAALIEGAIAMQTSLARSAQQIAADAMSGQVDPHAMPLALARAAEAARKPGSRRLRANLRRLYGKA